MRKRVAAVVVLAFSLALALVLAGCDMRQYSAADAEAVLQAGREKMEGWMGVNCPQGRIVGIENAVWKLPGGPEHLLPCVKGTISDGGEERDFFFNVETDEAYLQLNVGEYRAFQEECLSFTLECLGMEGTSVNTDGEGRGAFFYTPLIREMAEHVPDSPYSHGGIDGYSAPDYVKLPGQLVLSGDGFGDYVRDSSRGDVICVELDGRVLGSVELSDYTTERIELIEEEHGLYFKKLDLSADTESLSILWEGDGRFVDYARM